MDDDDPEKRIAELETGLSDHPHAPPPPRPSGWETYVPGSVVGQQGPTVVKRGGLRFLPVAMLVFGLVVPAVIGGIVFFAVVDPFAPDVKEQSADGLTAILESMREEFGDTMGYELHVYPEHAVLDRRKPGSDTVMNTFTYRDGDWNSWESESPVFSEDHVADLSRFDAAAVAATLARAAEQLGIPAEDSVFLAIEGGETGLRMSIRANSPVGGDMDITPDGSVVELRPAGG